MAISPISIADIYTAVRYTTQDSDGTRWTTPELFEYIDQAVRDIAIRLKSYKKTDTVSVSYATHTFTLNYEAIAIESLDPAYSYKLNSGSEIEFTQYPASGATAVSVDIKYWAYPIKMVYGTDTTLDLDLDLRDEVINYVISKCYSKEDSTEYIQKAQYFRGLYLDGLTRNSMRWHYDNDLTLAKNDYYI